MAREKRSLDPSDGDQIGGPEVKRQSVPALASMIVEALKIDSLQKICSSLEPLLRRVVSEEVERALAKLGTCRVGSRSSPKRIEGPDGTNLHLQFKSRLSLPIFTGGKVEGEQGASIHVVLIDANTGHVIASGPESSAKLDVLVLQGDFNREDDADWTEEEFETHVVKEREGKRPLLTGDLQVSLKEGVGTLGELRFTDNSSWIRSRKFRLGLRIASGCSGGVRVREAKTEPFTVKDHRGELYKKHYPPSLKDEVWRLEKIGKDGAFHKKLNASEICNVEDFLRLLVRDRQRLRNILGIGMSNKMWDTLVEHAKTCVLSEKHYIYYSDETRSVGAIFNDIYEFTGLIAGGQYFSAESLNYNQKVFGDALVKKAYENWMQAIEYDDGKALLSFKQNLTVENLTVEKPSMNTYVTVGGVVCSEYTENQSLHMNPNTNVHINSSSYTPHSYSVPPVTITTTATDEWLHPLDGHGVDDLSSEEEIRIRSNEILDSEGMQQLLRVLGMGGAEDGYGFPSYVPNYHPEDNRNQSSGKAVVGWLKIKAAMRWGIFIQKKTDERRAHVVEIEDDD